MERWGFHTAFVIMMVRTERKVSLCVTSGYFICPLTWLVIVVGVELGDQPRGNRHLDK